MLYREFGKTGIRLSSLGMGMSRFNNLRADDKQSIEQAAEVVSYALKQGVNYIDNAHNYSAGCSEAICRLAMQGLPRSSVYLAAKSSNGEDRTADDVARRIELSLERLGTDYLDFFYMWSITSGQQYDNIMQAGGAYKGALMAKEQGLVRHIVFSNHSPVDVASRIIKDGAFDGALLSYNCLNASTVDPLLELCAKQEMGVLVMNPLGGGLVPQNPLFFEGLRCNEQEDVSTAALRFVYSHPQVTCVLSGMNTREQVDSNVHALSESSQINAARISSVSNSLRQIDGLCTGCGYCRSHCPQGIDIPAHMQSYNMSLMDGTAELYRRTEPELLTRISVLKKLTLDYNLLPEDANNPCIGCGGCTKVCTQHLDIPHQMCEIYDMVQRSCASRQQYRNRLDSMLNGHGYRRVGFWPAANYTNMVIELYREFFGDFPFEVVLLDSAPARHGQYVGDYLVHAPQQLPLLKLDCLVISNYVFSDEIMQNAKQLAPSTTVVVPLHLPDDVPWVY